ncbi:MAG TPA: chromate efflux transporter, partial [Candidatus Limnocylindrales bacterium]|nr:chromate efflux transporter [Candidatus Limnocylindrales bacterium]
GRAREVFVESLRLGLTSFGGPIAHLGYQRRAFVERLAWVDEETFAALVALCQSLPGPASSQLSIAVGRIRAGWAGALAAFLGFTLPSAALMTLVGLLVAGSALPQAGPVAGAIAGLKAAAVAVVAHAVVTMAGRLAPDVPRLAVAGAAAIVVLAWPVAPAQLATIVGAAIIGWLAWGRQTSTKGDEHADEDAPDRFPRRVGDRRATLVLGLAFMVVLVAAIAAPVLVDSPPVRFAAAVARAGALVFGGGHVVLPLLDAGVVAPGWITPDAFVAGYGFAQAVPGPLFTFAAYLGAISSAGPGGVAGATISTVAIFLPGALLVLAALPVLGGVARRPWLAGSLRGVNAAVVGILAAALLTPVGTSGITSPATGIIAAAGTAGLLSGRLPPLVVVAGAAAVMAVLGAAGLK